MFRTLKNLKYTLDSANDYWALIGLFSFCVQLMFYLKLEDSACFSQLYIP